MYAHTYTHAHIHTTHAHTHTHPHSHTHTCTHTHTHTHTHKIGANAEIVHVLTSPDVVTCLIQDDNWSVKSLLNFIAGKHTDAHTHTHTHTPKFTCLIDTGNYLLLLLLLYILSLRLVLLFIDHCYDYYYSCHYLL